MHHKPNISWGRWQRWSSNGPVRLLDISILCAGMSGHVCVAGVGIGKWTQNGWWLGERERKSKSDMDIECKRETEKEGIGMWGEVVKDKK